MIAAKGKQFLMLAIIAYHHDRDDHNAKVIKLSLDVVWIASILLGKGFFECRLMLLNKWIQQSYFGAVAFVMSRLLL
jgi:hypothetical protein